MKRYEHEWKYVGGEYERCRTCGLIRDCKDDDEPNTSECPKLLRQALDAIHPPTDGSP